MSEKKTRRRALTEANLVLPGSRKTTQVRKQRSRLIWIVLVVAVLVAAWFVYGELSSGTSFIEFSGP